MRLVLFCLLAVVAGGCTKPQVALAPEVPQEVLIDYPILRVTTDHEDCPGRTEAVKTVDIRSRVSGYLDTIHFADGADVKQDDPLFTIDPRPYKVLVDQAQAQVELNIAQHAFSERDYELSKRLNKTDAVGKLEVVQKEALVAQMKAQIDAAKATLESARLNLEFTEIKAPFSGRVSYRRLDPKNVIKADDTLLTTLVALDPIYATFEVDERTRPRIPWIVRKKTVVTSLMGSIFNDAIRLPWFGHLYGKQVEVYASDGKPIQVEIGLAGEEVFSRKGEVTFIDNQIDPNTGTLRVRATVRNTDTALAPGMFVRVHIPVGEPHESLLVPEEAIGSDQGQKFVCILNEKDEPINRRVILGQQDGEYRVIEKGLAISDRVVVSGLQRVKPGKKVAPKQIERSGEAGVGSGEQKAK